jgi:hypothetical protein
LKIARSQTLPADGLKKFSLGIEFLNPIIPGFKDVDVPGRIEDDIIDLVEGEFGILGLDSADCLDEREPDFRLTFPDAAF